MKNVSLIAVLVSGLFLSACTHSGDPASAAQQIAGAPQLPTGAGLPTLSSPLTPTPNNAPTGSLGNLCGEGSLSPNTSNDIAVCPGLGTCGAVISANQGFDNFPMSYDIEYRGVDGGIAKDENASVVEGSLYGVYGDTFTVVPGSGSFQLNGVTCTCNDNPVAFTMPCQQ